MKLSMEQMKSTVRGAVTLLENEGALSFCRFTPEQVECYRLNRIERLYNYTRCSAGIKMAFVTDSRTLRFNYRLEHVGTGCVYAYVDVQVNGLLYGHFGEENGFPIAGNAEVAMPAGENRVEIWFPWAREAWISDMELDDGASFAPAPTAEKTMLFYGDSITHGCEARYSSLCYTALLPGIFGMEAVNKGIGGDIFFPELMDCGEPVDPAIVTVAYGTNDWSGQPRERTVAGCGDFFAKLSAKFPQAKIFAISPIWRADGDRITRYGEPCEAVETLIREKTAGLPNVHVVSGWTLVGHEPGLYADKDLHPNELGFAEYARRLSDEIKKYL